MYECMICGTEHKNLDDYAACVAACNARVKEGQRRAKEEQRKKEKTDRENKIRQLQNELNNEVNAFKRDYGCYPSQNRFDPIARLFEII